jgi:RND superfamily putative drug exporter
VIVFPIALVALLLVFGSVVAALMPLAVGAAGVALVLVSVFFATRVTDLSIFVLNLATMLGSDSLLTIRCSSPLGSGRSWLMDAGNVPRAVERTIATAGKAVFFSGATVLIGLMGLALFEFMFLRSVGISGVIVVAWSTIAALTLLPASALVVGTRIDRWSLPWRSANDSDREGFWSASRSR